MLRLHYKKMRYYLKNVPNELSLLRIFCLPLLWFFAFREHAFYLGLGIIFAGMTDALDGYIARKYYLITKLGSKLDTIADSLLTFSVAIWFWMLRPEIYLNHLSLWIVALSLCFLSLLIGIWYFRRFANLHLYTTKVAAIVCGFFTIHTFLADKYSPYFFYVAMGVFILSNVEAIAIQLTHSRINEHMGTILFDWILTKKQQQKIKKAEKKARRREKRALRREQKQEKKRQRKEQRRLQKEKELQKQNSTSLVDHHEDNFILPS